MQGILLVVFFLLFAGLTRITHAKWEERISVLLLFSPTLFSTVFAYIDSYESMAWYLNLGLFFLLLIKQVVLVGVLTLVATLPYVLMRMEFDLSDSKYYRLLLVAFSRMRTFPLYTVISLVVVALELMLRESLINQLTFDNIFF